MELLELKNKISSRYFDYQKLKSAIKGQVNERRYIGHLLKKGYLIRVKKGLYIWGPSVDNSPYSKEVLANLIYGPSYVSLESALAFYGLIPERVETMTSITIKKNMIFKSPIGEFEYVHQNESSYSLGVSLQIIGPKESFLIATKEKALLDTIAHRVKKIEDNISIRDLLFEDLRIDEVEFNKLDRMILLKLSSFYISRSVKKFMKKVGNG